MYAVYILQFNVIKMWCAEKRLVRIVLTKLQIQFFHLLFYWGIQTDEKQEGKGKRKMREGEEGEFRIYFLCEYFRIFAFCSSFRYFIEVFTFSPH